jgi:hypothetical protein
MTNGLTANVKRYGSAEPLPEHRLLRAGPVSALLENADLRHVRFGDVEIVQRLYMAVRDHNWDTIEPVFTEFTVEDHGDSFRVAFTAENVAGEVDFAWSGLIEGEPDGTIRCRMDGAPRRVFRRNRIGFCVLHPMELAGVPATVETPDGTTDGAFPDRISPHQPFIDMVAISHPVGGAGRATIRFEGDLFEVEDQRNWTDASFKTYGTPLRLPYPVEISPADRIIQSVTITVSGEAPDSTGGASRADVAVDFERLRPLPAIGFGAGRRAIAAGVDLEPLIALKPDHLWLELDLAESDWRDRLATASANAAAVGPALDLSVIGAGGESAWLDLADEIRDAAIDVSRVFAFPPPDEPITFPRSDLVTHRESIAAARSAFAASGIVVGGGSRAYFTELNRGVELMPITEMGAVTYPINPQVHAVDNLSIVENIAAQAATVESARAITGDRPLVIGPITLKPRYNPNATGPAPEIGSDRLPDPVDPRQMSLLGAGWTVGSINGLAAAGADALTYYELAGWRGLVERRAGLSRRHLFPSILGGIFPLYHVFAAIATFGEPEIASVSLADPLSVAAIALRNADQVRILVANLTNEERELGLDLAGAEDLSVRVLDETTYEEAATDPGFLVHGGQPLAGPRVALRPFALACIDGTR